MRGLADNNSSDYAGLFVEETSKQEQDRLYRLITIEIPNVDDPIYIVDSNQDVSLGGITYTKFPLQFSEIKVSNDGSVNSATLTVANPQRTFQAELELHNGLRGSIVTVKTIYEKFLDGGESPDPTAYIQDSFQIDSYTSTESIIQFSLDPIVNLDIKLPRRRFSNTSCYFRYKDPETCGYSGELTSCDKTLADCKKHYIIPPFSTGTITILSGSSTATFSEANSGIQLNDVIIIGNDKYIFRVKKIVSSTSVQMVETNTGTSIVAQPFLISRGNEKRFGGFTGIPAGTRRIIL